MPFKPSELIINPDGSIYHLNVLPGDVANTIIFVGDQDRVNKITQYFDTIEFTKQQREFKTTTGILKKKRITVISTGIGTDNIDIVLNELDALVNIDFKTRLVKKEHTSLNIIRIGTSGALQDEILVGSFLMSSFALDLVGMLHSYSISGITNPAIENAFINHTNWNPSKAAPLVISSNASLEKVFESDRMLKGITATAGGFYGPQGRVLRLSTDDTELNTKMKRFQYEGNSITNLEMETSAIYGLSKLLGHKAISLNAIMANRATGVFCENPEDVMDALIKFSLNKITSTIV